MTYPIAVDNKGANWHDWGNRFWPCIYLVDKQGNVRYRWDGELNADGASGEAAMRRKIEQLLRE